MSETTKTLLELLNDHIVVIPCIQRDYAQGRKGKESILDSFLSGVKSHFIDENGAVITSVDNPYTLDFVYGVSEKDSQRFYPLDGQQRLSTLWLLHWYVALKSGKLKDVKGILERFTYETRDTSTDFCKALCAENIKSDVTEIKSYLENQTWFFRVWLQDPTINAMLNGLDAIERIFGSLQNKTMNDLWIAFEQHLIVFELYDLNNNTKDSAEDNKSPVGMSLSAADDLFIKMNARGKPLSSFENFKSDLVSHLNDEKYSRLIDGKFYDFFWELARLDNEVEFNEVDNLFFQFVNRYALCKITCASFGRVGQKSKNILENIVTEGLLNLTDDEFRNEMKKELNNPGSSMDDNVISYKLVHAFKYINQCLESKADYKGAGKKLDYYPNYLTFLDYRTVIDPTFIEDIDKILWFGADKQKKVTEIIDKACERYFSGFSFFKLSDKTSTSFTNEQRIFFYAICRYMQLYGQKLAEDPSLNFNEKSFYDWIRIIRNLTRSAGVRSESEVHDYFDYINELTSEMEKTESMDIYDVLSGFSVTKDNRISKRVKEEIVKAERIIAVPDDKAFIQQAEDTRFFNGLIDFLYRDANNNLVWDKMHTRLDNIELLDLSEDGATVDTMRNVLKRFKSFDDIFGMCLFVTKGYHTDYKKLSFRDHILNGEQPDPEIALLYYYGINPDTARKKHKQLSDELLDNPKGNNAQMDPQYYTFVDSEVIKHICDVSDDGKLILQKAGEYDVIKEYKPGRYLKGMYLSSDRKERCKQLHDLCGVTVDERYCPYFPTIGYYWGLTVSFAYTHMNGSGNQEVQNFEWFLRFYEDPSKPSQNIIRCTSKKNREEEWDTIQSLQTVLDSFF